MVLRVGELVAVVLDEGCCIIITDEDDGDIHRAFCISFFYSHHTHCSDSSPQIRTSVTVSQPARHPSYTRSVFVSCPLLQGEMTAIHVFIAHTQKKATVRKETYSGIKS